MHYTHCCIHVNVALRVQISQKFNCVTLITTEHTKGCIYIRSSNKKAYCLTTADAYPFMLLYGGRFVHQTNMNNLALLISRFIPKVKVISKYMYVNAFQIEWSPRPNSPQTLNHDIPEERKQ